MTILLESSAGRSQSDKGMMKHQKGFGKRNSLGGFVEVCLPGVDLVLVLHVSGE